MISTILFYLFVNTLWCSIGYRWLAVSRRGMLTALVPGIARTFFWWIAGLMVLYTSMALQAVTRDVSDVRMNAYIFLYIPLTWIAWCITARIIIKKETSFIGFLLGGSLKQFLWRMFGTILSIIIGFPNTFLWTKLQRGLYEGGGN